jgi:uncharacterized membrane protein
MRKTLTLLYVAILAVTSAMAAVNRSELRHKLIGKRAVAGSVARGAAGTVVNSPHQWGRGPEGFAKRVGSSFGKQVIKQTIQAGVASAHHENLRYQPSNLRGTLPRVEYAVKSTFIVPRTNRAGKTVALGRVSGNMGAGLISQAWLPAAGVGAGVASGGIGLGVDVGVNVAREFWPRKHRRVRDK